MDPDVILAVETDEWWQIIALSYEPNAEVEQEQLQPDAEEVNEAEEKIEEVAR